MYIQINPPPMHRQINIALDMITRFNFHIISAAIEKFKAIYRDGPHLISLETVFKC